MSERELTKEQKDKLEEIMQEWMREVDQHFEAYKDEEIEVNRLDGPRTWNLAKIQLKYKKKINKELGMDFYEDVSEVEKREHKKFSDRIVQNPHGFPELPR